MKDSSESKHRIMSLHTHAAASSAIAPPASPRFEIRPLPGPLGAEVIGLSLDVPPDNNDIDRIRRAFLDHHVLVFRDMRITPEQHIAFSRRFGPLQVHVLNQFHLAGHPEILIVSNVVENGKPIGLGDAGADWHSDLSYKETPSLGSLLHAQELPRDEGDTLFANMVLAYDTLPPDVRRTLQDRTAIHSYVYRYNRLRALGGGWRPALTAEQIAQVPEVEHPVIRTHPETGRKALFVSEGFTARIVGLPDDESRALLDYLHTHSVKPEHVYTHRWQPHDLVFWDNRAVTHFAPGCPGDQRRTLYRTTVEGDTPY
jgi:taurine dioxygenase